MKGNGIDRRLIRTLVFIGGGFPPGASLWSAPLSIPEMSDLFFRAWQRGLALLGVVDLAVCPRLWTVVVCLLTV